MAATDQERRQIRARADAAGIQEVEWTRFECHADGAAKFWRVRYTDNFLETWWGRIDTNGQRSVKSYITHRACVDAYAAIVRAKTRKGYVLEGGAVITAPPAQTRVFSTLGSGRQMGRSAVAGATAPTYPGAGRYVTSGPDGATRSAASPSGPFVGDPAVRVVRESAPPFDRMGRVVPSRPADPLQALRPQIDPVTGRVAVFAQRDVRDGAGNVVHPRGYRQVLRQVDATEVITGNPDYGYHHPDRLPHVAVPPAETVPMLTPREMDAIMSASAAEGIERIRREAEATATNRRRAAMRIETAAGDRVSIGMGREQWEFEVRGTWNPDLTGTRAAVRPDLPPDPRRRWRTEGTNRQLEETPWQVFVHASGAERVYWRIRICGAYLETWTQRIAAGGRGPGFAVFPGNRAARKYPGNFGASADLVELINQHLADGYVPELALGQPGYQERYDKVNGKRAIEPVEELPQDGVIPLGKFRDLGDEEEI